MPSAGTHTLAAYNCPPLALCPAEPLIGPNSDPPQPYDPALVRSVVRWGRASGELDQTTEQDHRLVYEYVYAQRAWAAGGQQRGSCS